MTGRLFQNSLAMGRLAAVLAILATAATVGAVELPQEHDYQRVLRSYMATLTVKDFDHGMPTLSPFTVAVAKDPEKAYRDYMLVRGDMLPIIGSKRGSPCVTAPPQAFVLSALEHGDAVRAPPVWAEPIAWIVRWDNEGNPLKGSRAMKLRAFTKMAIEMIMTDHMFETSADKGMNRPDWFGYHMIMFAYAYADIRDALPAKVQKAYETGLRKMARRQLDWEVKREETNMDMLGAVGLWYAGEALNDPALAAEIKAYIHGLVADSKSFHPAGFFIDRHGLDVSFNGMTAFLVNWIALASGWDFANDTVNRRYRLRAHLCLPEPGGGYRGPSHFNSRLDSDAWKDQWLWGYRDYAGAMITDEAVYLTKFPSQEEIEASLKKAVGWFNACVKQTPRRRDKKGKLHHLDQQEIHGNPWKYRIWQSHNYAIAICFANDHYRNGTFARLKKLQEADSPWLRGPFERGETFIRNFEDAFVVTRMGNFAAILHTGPVGYDDPDRGIFHHAGPYGFGGGQLSAFWTPEAGPVLLGRRGGMNWDKSYDKVEDWKLWPIHAVTGATHDGKVFTSARIVKPAVKSEVKGDRATVRVSGRIPTELLGQGKVLQGSIAYERVFEIDPKGVAVTTSARAHGQDKIAELYETLPVFYPRRKRKKKGEKDPVVELTIEFQTGGKWAAATEEFSAVTAVRVTRLGGAIQITFDRPRRTALSPSEWKGGVITRDISRNVLIDLLDNGGEPEALNGTKRAKYRIAAVDKP